MNTMKEGNRPANLLTSASYYNADLVSKSNRF